MKRRHFLITALVSAGTALAARVGLASDPTGTCPFCGHDGPLVPAKTLYAVREGEILPEVSQVCLDAEACVARTVENLRRYMTETLNNGYVGQTWVAQGTSTGRWSSRSFGYKL